MRKSDAHAHILKICFVNCTTNRAFTVYVFVICTTSTTNEFMYTYVQLELLVKFAAYVPELVMCQIEAVYIYNANMAFRHYAYKLSSAVRIFSHIKVYMRTYVHVHMIIRVCTSSQPQFYTYLYMCICTCMYMYTCIDGTTQLTTCWPIIIAMYL